MPRCRLPARLLLEGSIPWSRSRHHVVHRRAAGPWAARSDRGGGRDLGLSTSGGILMQVTQLEWIVTLGVTIAVLLFDVLVMARRSGEPTMRWSAFALSAYIALAVLRNLDVVLAWPPVRNRVLRRLADRVQPVDRQPVHLPDHHGELRRAEEISAGSVVGRHRARVVFRGIFIAIGAVAIEDSPGSSTSSARSWCTPRSRWHATTTTTTTPRTRS